MKNNDITDKFTGIKILSRLLVLLLLTCSGIARSEDSCKPVGDMEFICGLGNAEDLVWLDDKQKWMITSSYGSGDKPGKLFLVNAGQRSFEVLFPLAEPEIKFNKEMFSDCPGAPDLSNFSTHGLSIRTKGKNLHWLYVTAHGAREAVEMFELDSSGAKPVATWIGCAVMPDDASINSVAVLEDGGFLTTRIGGRGLGHFQDIIAGKITGFVYEWRPGGKLLTVAGTELSGPNGIVMSPDGKWVFVAAWGGHQVVRFSRDGNGRLKKNATLELDFGPDNLRWTSDGTILATGHRLSDNQDCGQLVCVSEWETAEIDPDNLVATSLVVKKPVPGFGGATVTIRGQGGLWMGAFNGDRLVFIPE